MDLEFSPPSLRSTTVHDSLETTTASQGHKRETILSPENGGSVDAPPAYSRSKKPTVEASLTTFRCGFKAVTTDPDLYFSHGTMSSNEQDCTIILSPSRLEDTDWQVATLLEQAKLPPKPMIRLKGTHRREGTMVVDFDLCFDMTPYFLGDLHHMTIAASVAHSNSRDEVEMLLRHRVKAFQTGDKACKALTLERKLTNWDTDILDRKLRNLVHAAQYADHVSVSFPNRYSRVLLQNTPTEYTIPAPEAQDPTSLRSRLGQCLHWKRLKTMSHTRWDYYAIRAIWPYASGPPEDFARKSIKQGERDWFDRWSGPIRSAVLMGRKTWMTEHHYMTFKAGLANVKQPKYSWGSDRS